MTLIIENVKEEYLPAFKEFTQKMNATLIESNEISIPTLDEAIAEFEQGKSITYKSFEEYKARIDSE